MDSELSASVAGFFNGRSVFVTGATGFVGKALTEKLLRSCRDIKTIYILLRPSLKHGKSVQQRFDELLSIEVYENIRNENPELLTKLVPISGDVSMPDLGISLEDQQLLTDDVSIVFHCAARVRFDDNLKEALDSNVKGPKRMAELCRNIKHLKAVVHVSTAFNNLHRTEIAEVIYPTHVDPVRLINVVDTMDEKLLNELAKPLIGGSPNVYAYTKALGEQVLLNEAQTYELPLAVVRPSIISPALREPLPGWTDNLNAAMGMALGVGRGVLRCIPCDPNTIGDLIPVDYVVNLIIAAAWKQSTYKRGDVQVYNSATGTLNPITWGEFRDCGLGVWEKYPTKSMMWYPSVGLFRNRFVFFVMAFLSHVMPAYIVDAAMKLQGKKPFLARMYQRVHAVMFTVSFYMIHQWKFITRNSIELSESMTDTDRETFYFDVRDIKWKSYLETFILGVRQFLLKDRMDTLPAARRNLKILYYLRIVFRLVILGLTMAMFVKLFQAMTYIRFNSSDFPATDSDNTFVAISQITNNKTLIV